MGIKSKQKIYIDLVHYPLKTLGPGDRVGLWLQGCDILCKDCISPHNLTQTEDNLMLLDDLIDLLLNFDDCNKLTISGGEPFFQSEALHELLSRIRFKFLDILVYSGHSFEYLEKKFPQILDLIDVLIDGEFNRKLPTKKIYKGSNNQRLYIFNKELIKIYSEYSTIKKKIIQLHKTENNLYLLGIPDIKDRKSLIKILNKDKYV
jgi:anaerobic ribonucleoside-triphosphate reductase activating protein